ncbi:unnamed protein product [Brassica oleracea]
MFYSTSLEYSSPPTNLQSLSTSAETTPKREAKAHEVVNGTGAELDQISLREDMSNHERGMEKTTDHLHRQTVNSKKNCLTWRSKLGQQLELLRQLKTQAISRLCLLLTKAKATNPMKLTVLTREKISFRHSGGKSMQIAAKSLYHKSFLKINRISIENHLENFVSSTLYEVEEERFGVHVKGGLNEVPSFFAVF